VLEDSTNPVVQLCAAGMAVEGDAEQARGLFAKAWDLRRDDYDASIAAHFVARHQPTPEDTLRWNQIAVRHAVAVPDDRTKPFLASLYLNLGESQRVLGQRDDAIESARVAHAALVHVPPGGYREFVAGAIARLEDRLRAAVTAPNGARSSGS